MKRLVFVIPALVILSGCQGPSLVGSWTSDVAVTMTKVPVTLDIKGDGTWSGSMKTEGFSAGGMDVPPISCIAQGTWKVDGDTLTWANTKTTVTDAPALLLPFKGKLEEDIAANMNKWNSAKIKFPDNKSAELTIQSGDKIILNRMVAK